MSGLSPDGDLDGDLEWLSLDADESIRWAGSPDPRTIAPTALLLALPVLALAVVPFNTVAGLALAAVLAVVTVPIVGWAVLWLRSTNYVVTTTGLYEKHGVLSRDVKRIDLEKVQNTAYRQSALGTRFGYGHVEVSSAGGAGVEMRFRSVPEPRAVQQLISSHVSRSQEATRPETADPVEPTDEILVELRAIRAALENETAEKRTRTGSTSETAAETPADDVTLEHESTESLKSDDSVDT
ncbi:PH domain-containing protein [Natronorubrum aibiense]|uniref:PH domain-containing protein n=1 Tax=Natronorubrum aibiense TaxID=348826 RepID=A0A5P9P5K3_9EURY|nr:PH domain-containing protein [Natronorubrum aibiense]QFU83247.1 PH domain-containing protein [Natronorubrum aibiense]